MVETVDKSPFTGMNTVLHTSIAGQKIIKAVTFKGLWIVGLCKSLTPTLLSFLKSVTVKVQRR
jgi:hypothetical protein